MEVKVYAAFGYVLQRIKVTAGEVLNIEPLRNGEFTIDNPASDLSGSISGSQSYYAWMLLSGVHSYTDLETGVKELHYPGWSNLVDPIRVGKFRLGIESDGEYICFSPAQNQTRSPIMPKLEYFSMEDGESRNIEQGTKLYLIDGSLQVGKATMPKMRQIRFASGDKNVVAVGKVLGFVFKEW